MSKDDNDFEDFDIASILADEHEKHTKQHRRCVTGRWLDTLSDKTRKIIEDTAAERSMSRPVIYKAVVRIGCPVGDSAFFHHIAGACSCDRR